jgi:hypothetical protein
MKRYLLIILAFMFSVTFVSGQLYCGNSTSNNWCLLRINKDSSIDFVYSRNLNEFYGEHKGTIKKINDTLYHITAVMTIGKTGVIGPSAYDTAKHTDNGIDYFKIDTPYVHLNDSVIIEYANGQRQIYVPYDHGEHTYCVPDKKFFSKKEGVNYYFKIIINRKNAITGQQLSFRVPFHSAPIFDSGKKLSFDVIIKNNVLWTTEDTGLDIGQFVLNKNKY